MITTLNNSSDNSLPTPTSNPRRWEGGTLPPLTLRVSELDAATQPQAMALPALTLVPVGLKKQLLLLVGLTALCLAAYYVMSHYVATAVVVQGRSMVPTLQDGDRFILNRLSYVHHSPERGDLVVVKDPGHSDYAVKRIVAMPREALFFKKGEVMLNGKRLFEPYLASGTQTFLPDAREKMVVLGGDQYFVLGDNRGNSEDSRFYGAIHRSQIVGEIVR